MSALNRNMSRRTFAIGAGAAAVGAALAGCSGSSTTETESDSETLGTLDPEEVEGDIVFSAWGSDAELELDQQILDAFMEDYPNVNVTFEAINDDYQTKIETMLLAGEAPDVIYGHPKYFIEWAAQGLLYDLTNSYNSTEEFFDEDVYATNIYEAFTYGDQRVSTINGADTFLLFYNQDLFDEAGVDYPTDDWTWDDFLAACEALTKDTDGDGKIDQYAFATSTGYEVIEAFMGAYGGALFDDVNNPTEVVANSDANLEALQMWYDLIHTYGYAPDSAGSEVVAEGFDGGQIAMDVNGVYQCVYRSGVDFNMGLASLPMTADDSHYVALMAGYTVPATTQYPEAAWALARYMQQEKGQQMLASNGLITTVNKEVANSDEALNFDGAPDNHVLRVTSLDNAVNVDAKLTNWTETLERVFTPAIESLYNKDITVEECLEQIQTGLEEDLADGMITTE